MIAALLLATMVTLPAPTGRGRRASTSLSAGSAPGEGRAAASKERTVTLDVKDEDARSILTSMQQQCAIKNLLIDRDVEVRGTFLFRSVPCSTAFRVVFQSLGLGATSYGNTVVSVGRNKR